MMSSKNRVWQIHFAADPDGVEVEFARDDRDKIYSNVTDTSTRRLEDIVNHPDAILEIELPQRKYQHLTIVIGTLNLQGRHLSQEE